MKSPWFIGVESKEELESKKEIIQFPDGIKWICVQASSGGKW